MDAFFASASLLARPDLVGTPVIIGGAGNRGVVLSATYEARAFGVTSAMPMGRARRLCPQATILPPDHGLYSGISDAVMETFAAITPIVEPLSLDEAFLDVSGGAFAASAAPPPSPSRSATRCMTSRASPARSGSPPSKFVAKLASGLCKPDGLLVVPVAEVVTFVQQLPVGRPVGRGGEDRGASRPARPGHRRRYRAHPRSHPACAPSATPPAATCTTWPGGATRDRVEPVHREKSIGS
jgi:DNA polymerase-4